MAKRGWQQPKRGILGSEARGLVDSTLCTMENGVFEKLSTPVNAKPLYEAVAPRSLLDALLQVGQMYDAPIQTWWDGHVYGNDTTADVRISFWGDAFQPCYLTPPAMRKSVKLETLPEITQDLITLKRKWAVAKTTLRFLDLWLTDAAQYTFFAPWLADVLDGMHDKWPVEARTAVNAIRDRRQPKNIPALLKPLLLECRSMGELLAQRTLLKDVTRQAHCEGEAAVEIRFVPMQVNPGFVELLDEKGIRW